MCGFHVFGCFPDSFHIPSHTLSRVHLSLTDLQLASTPVPTITVCVRWSPSRCASPFACAQGSSRRHDLRSLRVRQNTHVAGSPEGKNVPNKPSGVRRRSCVRELFNQCSHACLPARAACRLLASRGCKKSFKNKRKLENL